MNEHRLPRADETMANATVHIEPQRDLALRQSARLMARQKAGLTLQQAATRARICPAYLLKIEKSGRAPYVLAMRLSRLYRCPCQLFL